MSLNKLVFLCIIVWMCLLVLGGCASNPVNDSRYANAHAILNTLKMQYPNDKTVQATRLVWKTNVTTAQAYGTNPSNAKIWIGPSVVQMARNNHELAMVLAHELAHIKYRHSQRSAPNVQERYADQEGARTLTKAGYNCKAAAKFWLRLYDYNIGWGRNSRGVWYDTHKQRHDTVVRTCKFMNALSKVAK